MSLKHILKLGDPKLHEVSVAVEQHELEGLKPQLKILHNALMDFRSQYGAGRAVAAPQIGLSKRLIYLHIDKPISLYNPEITDFSSEKIEVWDDCLCFPGLLVKVLRAKRISLKFKDEHWVDQVWKLEGDMSELIQHEYDHLDGILATQRAIDNKSFRLIR